eukprot:311633-Prorocentrum_minimum.AAC.1
MLYSGCALQHRYCGGGGPDDDVRHAVRGGAQERPLLRSSGPRHLWEWHLHHGLPPSGAKAVPGRALDVLAPALLHHRYSDSTVTV